MKRKGLQEIEEDFSSSPFGSHPAKSRRLDGELLQSLGENPRFDGEEVMGECLELEPQTVVNEVLQREASATGEAMLLVDNPNEKAIVLYQPPVSRSPSSRGPEFAIVLNSGLIPGLRDRFFWWGNQKEDKSDEDQLSIKGSDNSLAVIPWVAPQPLMNTVANGQPTVCSEAMEAEDTEMMDTDESPDCYGGSVPDSGVCRTAEGNELQHQWQQQQQLQRWMMLPGAIQNTPTPITW